MTTLTMLAPHVQGMLMIGHSRNPRLERIKDCDALNEPED